MRLSSKLSQLIHSGPTSCAALRMPRWKEARRRLPARPSIRKSLWFIVRLLRTLPGGKWRGVGFVPPPPPAPRHPPDFHPRDPPAGILAHHLECDQFVICYPDGLASTRWDVCAAISHL